MKRFVLALTITLGLYSCVTTSPSASNQTSSSSEMEARRLTTQMKQELVLTPTQEEKVLVINVVNLSLLKKLRESNQLDQISKTKEKYKSEMKEVLNTDQYSKFLVQFGNI